MNILFDKIKLFKLSTQMAERDLDYIEGEFDIDLQRAPVDQKDEEFYPQFFSVVD